MDCSNFLRDNILNCCNSHLCLLGVPAGIDSFQFAFLNAATINTQSINVASESLVLLNAIKVFLCVFVAKLNGDLWL